MRIVQTVMFAILVSSSVLALEFEGENAEFAIYSNSMVKRAYLGSVVVMHTQVMNKGSTEQTGKVYNWIDDNDNGDPDADEDQCTYETTISPRNVTFNGCGISIQKSLVGEHTMKSRFVPHNDASLAVDYKDIIDIRDSVAIPEYAEPSWWDKNESFVIIGLFTVFSAFILISLISTLFVRGGVRE